MAASYLARDGWNEARRRRHRLATPAPSTDTSRERRACSFAKTAARTPGRAAGRDARFRRASRGRTGRRRRRGLDTSPLVSRSPKLFVKPVALIVTPWGDRLDRYWRAAVTEALRRHSDWCLACNGMSIRIVDARRLYLRRFGEFDLATTLIDRRTAAAFRRLASSSALLTDLRTTVVARSGRAFRPAFRRRLPIAARRRSQRVGTDPSALMSSVSEAADGAIVEQLRAGADDRLPDPVPAFRRSAGARAAVASVLPRELQRRVAARSCRARRPGAGSGTRCARSRDWRTPDAAPATFA